MYPLSDFVQEYRFSVFLAAESCQISEFNNLELSSSTSRFNRNLIEDPILPWTVYIKFNYSL